MKVSKDSAVVIIIKNLSNVFLGVAMVTTLAIAGMYIVGQSLQLPVYIYFMLIFGIVLYTEYHKDFHMPEWLGVLIVISSVLSICNIIFHFLPDIGVVEFLVLLGVILYILNSYLRERRLS